MDKHWGDPEAEKSIEERVAAVQRQFDQHAELNNEPPEDASESFAVGDEVHWRGRHKITGKIVTGVWGKI